MKTLKDVRLERTLPGHKILADKFDQEYLHKQRKLINRAYMAVRMLRSMLMNHPLARHISVSHYLEEGLIWSH